MFIVYIVGQYFRRQGLMEVEHLNKSSAKDKWHLEASSHEISEEQRQEQRRWMNICVYTKDLELELGGVGLPIAYSWQDGKGKSWLGNELKGQETMGR